MGLMVTQQDGWPWLCEQHADCQCDHWQQRCCSQLLAGCRRVRHQQCSAGAAVSPAALRRPQSAPAAVAAACASGLWPAGLQCSAPWQLTRGPAVAALRKSTNTTSRQRTQEHVSGSVLPAQPLELTTVSDTLHVRPQKPQVMHSALCCQPELHATLSSHLLCMRVGGVVSLTAVQLTHAQSQLLCGT